MKTMRLFFLSVGILAVSVFPVLAAPTDLNPYGSIFTGRQAVTATAAALSSHPSGEFCVKASLANLISVFIGPAGVTTANGQELAPGESACLRISNTNLVYVVASTTGAEVTYHGLN